jgi:hypothetical protein
LFRYLVEYGLKSQVESNVGIINLNQSDNTIIFDFNGSGSYTKEPNSKIIVPATDFADALQKVSDFALPIILKFMMVYRMKLVISPLHYILEGAKGLPKRKCRVSKLHRGDAMIDSQQLSQDRFDSIMNTNFTNTNDIALNYFRLAILASNKIDAFRNLRLSLEALIKPRSRKRFCDNCNNEIVCKCGQPSVFNTVMDDDIVSFWINTLHGFNRDIYRITKIRHKSFHAANIDDAYPDLDYLNHQMETNLAFYFTMGTQFIPVYPSRGAHYYLDTDFTTKTPMQEFPEDFPDEEYWKNIIPSP